MYQSISPLIVFGIIMIAFATCAALATVLGLAVEAARHRAGPPRRSAAGEGDRTVAIPRQRGALQHNS